MSEKVYFTAEKFELKTEQLKDGSESIILEGVAMPLNKMSRNKVFYRPESVQKACETMKGAAFLFNHNTDISLGHVEDSSIDNDKMMYRANLDPEETKYVNKIKRQDIRHVSVGCMVNNVEFNEDGSVICDVEEFVELSLVPIPGFAGATAQIRNCVETTPLLLAEKFGNEEMVKKLKEAEAEDEGEEEPESEEEEKTESLDEEDENEEEEKDDEKDDETEEKTEADEPEEESEETDDEKEESTEEEDPKEIMNQINSKLEDLYSKFDEVNNRLAIVESNIDAINDSEESTEPAETEEPEIEPDTSEKFRNEKVIIRSNEDQKKKEETLDLKEKKSKNKKVIDLDLVRLKNISY